MDDASHETLDWFDREELLPQNAYRIEITDGVVERVTLVAGDPNTPEPKFLVREIETDDSLEHDRVSGIDDQGQKFAEHPVPYVGPELTE